MRSKLFVPGSRPELFAKALAGDADAISFDVEDSVPEDSKPRARGQIADFLRSGAARDCGKTLIVRVNALGSAHFEGDLMAFACAQVALLNLPKVQSAADVRAAAAALESAERRNDVTRPIGLLINVETARGLRLAHEIAAAHPRVAGLQLGLADLFESMHADRRCPANVHAAMFQMSMACAESRKFAYDSAYPDVADTEGFRREAEQARQLGYVGKSCIHPKQVALANEVFGDRRFTHRQAPKPVTWDGAPTLRTWDIWTHSYLILGLLEADRHTATGSYLEAACRIGELCLRTLTSGGVDITDLGNHHGLSATVLMDPALELHFATGEQRFLDLALRILDQAERNPRLALLMNALAGADASEVATGKAYQLIWNLLALAKLHRATGDADHLRAVTNLWRNIRDHHLTLGGGPWGGVAHRSREVFNPAGVFSPYGYVETCSTLAWIQLNRELLAITGEAAYAEEIERSAYNDLLGAQAPDGEDWCYYSFPNGRRVHTTHWRCCKSSGAIALEELPAIAYATAVDGVRVNLLGPSEAELRVRDAGVVRLEQRTDYPFDGAISIRVAPERSATFAVHVRIPQWAGGASVRVNGESIPLPNPPPNEGGQGAGAPVSAFVRVHREWRNDDVITVSLPMRPQVQTRTHSNTQESRAPDGSPVRQEVLHFDYLAVTRGPLVYATGLIDGYKVEETLRVPPTADATWLETVPAAVAAEGPDVRVVPIGRPALIFSPYYRAGGRRDRTWRLTWMQLAPESP